MQERGRRRAHPPAAAPPSLRRGRRRAHPSRSCPCQHEHRQAQALTMKSVKRSTWPLALSTISGVTAGHSTWQQGSGRRRRSARSGTAELLASRLRRDGTHRRPAPSTHLQHVLLQHKVVAPLLSHIRLHGAAGRAVVWRWQAGTESEREGAAREGPARRGSSGSQQPWPARHGRRPDPLADPPPPAPRRTVEAGHGAVNLEGGDVEQAALQRVGLRAAPAGAGGWAGSAWQAGRGASPGSHPSATAAAFAWHTHHGCAERLLVGARSLARSILVRLRAV